MAHMFKVFMLVCAERHLDWMMS